MKINESVLSIFPIIPILVALISSILLNPADADADYMDELRVVRLKEKLEAPSFILKNLKGKEVKLADYRGKIILLNFWATWCGPCRIEMPSMEKLYTAFKDHSFIILAVDLQEDREQVVAFKEKLNLTFPILLDSDGEVGANYGVMALPTTYLVDREGSIIGAAMGPRDWSSGTAFGLIDQLISASPDS